MTTAQDRFRFPAPLERPKFLPDYHWDSILYEQSRLHEAFASDDRSDIIGQLKVLVECVAHVTTDLMGQLDHKRKYGATLDLAHDALVRQPGNDLSSGGNFAAIASNAKKMASRLGEIRNELGTGHGRARAPQIQDEMVTLCLSGAMTWVEWALRRLGPLASGRPSVLISELDDGSTFRSGDLTDRLTNANIPALERHHQRALGVAVGQRAVRGTFNVQRDGVEPSLNSDLLDPWTPEYRQGLAEGLLRDRDGRFTLTHNLLTLAIQILNANPDNTEFVDNLAADLEPVFVPIPLPQMEHWVPVARLIVRQMDTRPHEEQAWSRLSKAVLARA